MRRKSFRSLGPHGFHRVSYFDWGDEKNPSVLICVHGLTRCGRDFDVFAAALADKWRVICPDLPGRGESDWLPVKTDYILETYCADLVTLIAHAGAENVVWLGTSLGGIIGTALASHPNSPIERLIVNDIGPFIPGSGLQRIAKLVGTDPYFICPAEAEDYVRQSMSTFGVTSEEDWRFLVEISTRPAEGGGFRLHYDPGIAEAFRGSAYGDINFWGMWDALRCPTLALRGVFSDILSREVADEMTSRGPRATLIEFEGCGHAPTLMSPEQIDAVRAWLDAG